VEHREATHQAAAGSVHEAKAPAAAKPAAVPAGNEPIILGVGVPASEL
jgi:ribonuclease E